MELFLPVTSRLTGVFHCSGGWPTAYVARASGRLRLLPYRQVRCLPVTTCEHGGTAGMGICLQGSSSRTRPSRRMEPGCNLTEGAARMAKGTCLGTCHQGARTARLRCHPTRASQRMTAVEASRRGVPGAMHMLYAVFTCQYGSGCTCWSDGVARVCSGCGAGCRQEKA